MCRRRCRRGCGCWVRARAARTTRTMLDRRRSQHYVTRGCERPVSIATSPRFGCWLTVITISAGCGLSRRVGCIDCCAHSSPAVTGGACPLTRPNDCWPRSVRSLPSTRRERQWAVELLDDVRRLDAEIVRSRRRVVAAIEATRTSLTELYGVGPVVAAIILGHVGDVRRFPTRDHFASYNATAPIEASSGPKKRHRLNPRGNRIVNYALHMA